MSDPFDTNMNIREIPVELDEIDAAQVVALDRKTAAAQFDAEGRLLRTVITTKDFLAGTETFDHINGLAKGQVAYLGTLAGEIYSCEKTEKEYSFGGGETKLLTSYWLNGVFEAVVASTGEVFQAGQAILPKNYGVQCYNAFRDLGVTSITLGVAVGLRRSTRPNAPVPHEWVVRDHMQQAATSRVSAISKQLGVTLGLAAPEAQKRLAGKK